MRKKIPERDKKLVIERLAQGHSLRKAIVGTKVESENTAMRLSRTHAHDIAQVRNEYMDLIEREFKADRKWRAERLAEMTYATRIKSSMTEPDREVPDWKTRLEAIKYIDKLGGLNVDEPAQINLNAPTLILDARVPVNVPTQS